MIARFTIFAALFFGSFRLIAGGFYEKITQFSEDKIALDKKYPNSLSDKYFSRFKDFYTDNLKVLANYDFDKLSKQEKIDYVLLKNHIEKNVYFLQLNQKKYDEVKFVAANAKEIYEYLENRKAGKRPDAQLLAGQFNLFEKTVSDNIEKLSKEKPFDSWQKADLAADIIKKLNVNIEEAKQFYLDYDPLYYWWMKTANASLTAKLAEYEKALRKHFVNTVIKDDGSGIIGNPIGREALNVELKSEFINYTPEELIIEANKQFAWCEKEMLKASIEMGFGNDWKAALEKVKQSYYQPGQWPQEVNRIAMESIDFIEKRDLITIPPLAKETFGMYMLSAEQQKKSPFFLGGESILIAYPTIDMGYDDKIMSLRGNNPNFSRATIQHELIPGHNLQSFMMQRYNTHRQLFYTPFWMEGWALYWEFNLWDKNFPRTPEERIGMLFWRMHRCVRIIFSLNYHLGNMTPKQCIDLLVNKVGHEQANAEAEVRRSFTGSYGPLYQIAYVVGGLQFYALKNEMVNSGKMTEKQFHDAILHNGTIPVELVRYILNDTEINADATATWRFLN